MWAFLFVIQQDYIKAVFVRVKCYHIKDDNMPVFSYVFIVFLKVKCGYLILIGKKIGSTRDNGGVHVMQFRISLSHII